MALIMLSDGWRDESSECPYTETLQTKYDWERQALWYIIKYSHKDKYQLNLSVELIGTFVTLEEAKEYVNEYKFL